MTGKRKNSGGGGVRRQGRAPSSSIEYPTGYFPGGYSTRVSAMMLVIAAGHRQMVNSLADFLTCNEKKYFMLPFHCKALEQGKS